MQQQEPRSAENFYVLLGCLAFVLLNLFNTAKTWLLDVCLVPWPTEFKVREIRVKRSLKVASEQTYIIHSYQICLL